MNRLFILTILLLITVSAIAQDRYVVYFKDKSGSPFSVQQPQSFLSQRALQRRIKQDVVVTEQDFPVSPVYTQQLKLAGAQVFYGSRWLNCALVQMTTDVATVVRGLSFVTSVELVAPGVKLNGARVKSFASRQESGLAPATKSQLEMIGIDQMHSEDIRGEGVLVAVFDSGFQGVNTAPPFKHLFDENRVVVAKDLVANAANVYRYDDHGTEVLSVIAASSASFTGGAYKATFQLYVTEDVSTEYRIEEYNWLIAAERADSSGVDLISSSLGYNTFDNPAMDYDRTKDLDGKTAIISKAAKSALDRGIVVVVSAGNEGNNSWVYVTPPADVDGVLAVGAINGSGIRASFSSKGPTTDGRFKPDVVALGSGTSVVNPNGNNTITSGTSVAAPLVASLAIGLIQKFPDLPATKIHQTIRETASKATTPDNLLGYGIPNYVDARSLLESTEAIIIYPNPMDTGKFNVKFDQINVDATITIFDAQGRMLSNATMTVNANSNPLVIDMEDLPAGTYLVKVKTKDNFKTLRMVKL